MRPAKMMIPRAQPRATRSSSRSRTIQACDPCRKRKAKCNGAKPCLYCDGLEIACTYTQLRQPREVDQLRSKTQRLERMVKLILSRASASQSAAVAGYTDSLSRNTQGPSTLAQQSLPGNLDSALGLVQRQLGELHQIYQTIQECDLEILPRVISTIRYSASVHDAANRLGRQIKIQQAQMTLERMQQVWMTRLSGQAEMIEQEAPYSVHTTKLWSAFVTDRTASHLFSLFFVWDNPIWRVIEPSLFLRSFATGDTRFCSSLLVHTILFYACHFSYNLEKPWDRHEEIATAKQLFQVIERLWHRDKARICVPTMQSSLLLGLFFCGTGKDRIGARYIQYGALMALRLGLHTSSTDAFRDNPRAHKIIACAVYDVESISVQVSARSSVWPGPPQVFLNEAEASAADLNEQWAPYPFRHPVYRPYTNTGTWARRCLLILVNDVAQLSCNLGNLIDLDTWYRGAALYKKLDAFKRTLPSVLDVERNKSPHNLCLYLYYYTTVVNLCGIFISRRGSSTTDSLVALTAFDPHSILEKAMDSMGTLILLYRASHGWKSTPLVMLHYFLIVGIHAASHLELPKWREILVTCVAGLWHMSLSWRLSRAFLRTIELVLNSNANSAHIPIEVLSILREHHEKIWTSVEVNQLAANYVVHHYPNLTPEAGSGNNGSGRFHGQGLERLIRAFDRLST
ncbi:Zn(II)2Cys6 transcription factor [Aspergillus ibericus CBS 121593]|uniref:Zn(2)-C6 fungal-type domain-containing protein n=1 Tax=Aspergillus ibericus CBS 121593 TaxID=1448316 RepID=A0A395H5X6_9EURO|nr:hypothetical protein BO80DRAFT_443357 [Aspergillus ibericus CBS 121593]RAL02555.1 hypothetical protein BO80DRAFT_443357 [Aspergillus ibericus CBS 121593]